MRNENLQDNNNEKRSSNKDQQKQKSKVSQQSIATTSTPTTSRSKEKKIENLNDLIEPCLNKKKEIHIEKKWCTEISNNLNNISLNEIKDICDRKLKSGENLPIYFPDNGLNFAFKIKTCEHLFYNNDLITSKYTGQVLFNTHLYYIEGDLNVCKLSGTAKIIKEPSSIQKSASSFSVTSNSNIVNNEQNEKINIQIKQEYDEDQLNQETNQNVEVNTASTSSSTSSDQTPWSKKKYYLKKYQDS